MRIKRKVITKYNEGEKYTFKNGVATVPGAWWQGVPMTVTLKEFKELIK